MIHYHPGTWGICFAFQLTGSVFPKSFAWAGPCAVITLVVHTMIRMPSLKGKVPEMEVGASIMGYFASVLGFLIVFRVNQAYSRWWEGGALLQQIRGNWFTAYSSLLAFVNEHHSCPEDVENFKHKLARLISLLYSSAIHQVSTADDKVFEVIDIDGFSPEHIEFMAHAHDRCEVILQWIQKLVVEANVQKLIDIAPPILSRVYNQLGNGIVNLNNARKIAEFPIPFPLAQMITVMLLYHMFVTCMVCAFSIETSFYASMFAFVIIFSFQSINYIALELENPFGDDPNDLPLQEMPRDMNSSLIELLEKRASCVPTLALDVRHKMLHTRSCNFDTELCAMANGELDTESTPPRVQKGSRETWGHQAKIKEAATKWPCNGPWYFFKKRDDSDLANSFQPLAGDAVGLVAKDNVNSNSNSRSASAGSSSPRVKLVGKKMGNAELSVESREAKYRVSSPEAAKAEVSNGPSAQVESPLDIASPLENGPTAVALPVSSGHEANSTPLLASSESPGRERGVPAANDNVVRQSGQTTSQALPRLTSERVDRDSDKSATLLSGSDSGGRLASSPLAAPSQTIAYASPLRVDSPGDRSGARSDQTAISMPARSEHTALSMPTAAGSTSREREESAALLPAAQESLGHWV